jgi:hypothetical protein
MGNKSLGEEVPAGTFVVGVMGTAVEGKLPSDFRKVIDRAAEIMRSTLLEEKGLEIRVYNFEGPNLVPQAASFSPFDFLRLGISEKIERRIPFLLIVSDVNFSTTSISYAHAFPSRLMNIGILSLKRLSPSYWGEKADPEITTRRLAGLMLHTFGHLLNLSHHPDPDNVMYDFVSVEDLEKMQVLLPEQLAKIRRTLPEESRDAVQVKRRLPFVINRIIKNTPAILRAVIRANPFRLVTYLPTMMAAAFSVIIALFFSAEIWDVASTIEVGQMVLFSGIALVSASSVLYRSFALGSVLTRRKQVVESTIVTTAATMLSLILTMVLLYGLFLGVTYLSTVVIFPRRLMVTWPTVDPAVRVIDHLKLSMFLASVGTLAGSLGGRADSSRLIRSVLFLDEET